MKFNRISHNEIIKLIYFWLLSHGVLCNTDTKSHGTHSTIDELKIIILIQFHQILFSKYIGGIAKRMVLICEQHTSLTLAD